MALRGIKPETIKKRLKIMMFGEAGAGKTTASIQFPTPYYIDCERGAEHDQYVELLKKSDASVFKTSDFNEILNEVIALLTEKHSYKTLIIDPFTIVYDELLRNAEIKLSKNNRDGTEFGRHYSEANKHIKHLISLLYRLDMNVIVTCHSKKEYGGGMSVIGNTFDGYKKLDYVFDLVLQIQKRGKERHALVTKSRIKGFEDMESFIFSYDAIAEKYGRDIIEKDCVNEILATPEQVNELRRFIELLKINEETIAKWLDKCSSNSFEEMPCDCIQKCIDHLKTKLN